MGFVDARQKESLVSFFTLAEVTLEFLFRLDLNIAESGWVLDPDWPGLEILKAGRVGCGITESELRIPLRFS